MSLTTWLCIPRKTPGELGILPLHGEGGPHREQRLQLLQRLAHEVTVGLGVAMHTVAEEALRVLMELGQLVQQLGVQGLVVVPGRLQLLQGLLVLQLLCPFCTVIEVQKLVKAFLHQLVGPREHVQ